MPIRVRFLKAKINDSLKALTAKIIFASAKTVDQMIIRNTEQMEVMAKDIIFTAFETSPTFSSLLSGKLKADFGLTDELAFNAKNEIVSHIVNNIKIQYNLKSSKDIKAGKGIFGSFDLVLKPDPDFYEKIKSGSYISNGAYVRKYGLDGKIDWLEWLLTRGTEIVIAGFEVKYGRLDNSRSQLALMIEGDSFRVDPEFAGTIEDNFVTRTIESVIPQITQNISKMAIR